MAPIVARRRDADYDRGTLRQSLDVEELAGQAGESIETRGGYVIGQKPAFRLGGRTTPPHSRETARSETAMPSCPTRQARRSPQGIRGRHRVHGDRMTRVSPGSGAPFPATRWRGGSKKPITRTELRGVYRCA
jgi:hypothetical protein